MAPTTLAPSINWFLKAMAHGVKESFTVSKVDETGSVPSATWLSARTALCTAQRARAERVAVAALFSSCVRMDREIGRRLRHTASWGRRMPPLPTTGWWPTQQEIFTVRPSMADLTMTALFTSSLRKRSLPLSGDPFPQRKGCWFIVEPGSPVFQLLIYV